MVRTARGAGVAATLLAALLSTSVGAPPAGAQPFTSDVQHATRATLRASVVLKSLEVRTERRSGYSRDYFRLWLDTDRDGCDTRREVLISEAVVRPDLYGRCSFSGGMWRSAYDGVTTTDSSSFDIDHLVPLAEAWDSGAWRWSSATRDSYANDLDFSGSLIAVSATSNRSKSDQDPAEWLPPASSYWCTYATTWIAVKYRWHLSVDRSEKGRLMSLISSCGNPRITLPAKASITNGTTSGGSGGTGGSGGGGTGGGGSAGTDPRFSYCYQATAAGYGPYTRGVDDEYWWYTDGDGDGVVCE